MRLAAALARCWAYANEAARARPFAAEALDLAQELDEPPLLADALDAALASHWGPDELPDAESGPCGSTTRPPTFATPTHDYRRSCGG